MAPHLSDVEPPPAEIGPFERWLKLAETLLRRDSKDDRSSTSSQGLASHRRSFLLK